MAATGGTSSISGLASGIDSASIVTQLMQIESRPQTLLKNQLTTAQTTARALREINTSLAALSSAAQALTGTGAFTARTATSSSKDVTAAATAAAQPGSRLTFTVTALSAAQTSISSASWSSPTGDVRTAAGTGSDPLPAWPITVLGPDGKTVLGTVDVPAGGSLNDAAAAINAKKNLGLQATVIKLDSSHYKLQVTSTATGTSHAFTLLGSGEDPAASTHSFATLTAAQDAKLTIGSSTATSPDNTFADLLTGVSVTVSQVSSTPTTVTVATDKGGISDKVQALVSAATTALTTIGKYTDSSPGSDAPLKGNPTLTGLATQILAQMSKAVGGSSPAVAGLQLTRDGGLTFDPAKLTALLQSDPATAQKIVGGATGPGQDGMLNTPDDTVDTDGLAARLFVVAKNASDSATGLITSLANGQDARAKSLQKDIDGWDLRLDQRKSVLTAKFQAMETALGTLNSQSSWLSSQINQLPSWNQNKK